MIESQERYAVPRHHPFLRHHRAIRHADCDINDALKYLKNPTHSGIWRLEATWHTNSGIVKYILNSSKQKVRRDSSKSSREMLEYRLERVQESLGEVDNVSFLLGVLLNLKIHKEGSNEEEVSYYRAYSRRLLNINGTFIEKNYGPAVKFFNEHIYFQDFGGRIGNYLAGIKSGNILGQKGPSTAYKERASEPVPETVKLEIIAFKKEPLEDIYELLSLLGVVTDKNIYTVFSPEEELLYPYTETVSSLLPKIGLSRGIVRHYNKMLTDYENGTYTACITTAGLVAEEYLIQIYETLSRKKCPPSQMLGRTYNLIGELAKELLSPDKVATHSSSGQLMKTLKTKKATSIESGMLTVAHSLLGYIDNKFLGMEEHLASSKKHDTDYSIFPDTVKAGIENVILYRNAASHKSTFPIDALEAQKSVYGSLSLVLWWEAHRNKIDGSLSEKDILDQLIESAKKYDEVA